MPAHVSPQSCYSTWLEIDLEAIRSNLRRLVEISGRPVMGVVKANAYGHGIVEVGRVLQEAGARWLAVARLEEAVVLRAAGISLPVLVLGYLPPERTSEAASLRISAALYDPELGARCAAAAREAGHRLGVHIKVDSGMGRLGVPTEGGLEFARWASETDGLAVEGLFTHFARSDEPGQPSNVQQLVRFNLLLDALSTANLRPAWVHAANSAATLNLPGARYDLVRPGIALYGLHPSAPECTLSDGFRPALSWKATLTSVKLLPAGHGVGYGHMYVTKQQERFGVLPVGYADGFRRMLPSEVLMGGKRLPVHKRVCMDQTLLNLDALPEAKAGDEAVLIGSQGPETICIEDLARRWNTNNYDVVCGLAARLPRVYLNP